MENKDKNQLFAFFLALMVIAIWGETFVSSKILLEKGLRPADILLFRFVIAYIGMWLISPKKLWADSVRDELSFAAMGLFGVTLYFLSENTALQYSTASNVAILVACTPFVTSLMLSIFYKDERMTARQIGGSVLAFAGLVLVVLNGELVLKLNPLGDILAFCASISWGFYSLFFKIISPKYSSSFLTRKVFAYGLLTIVPYFMQNGWPSVPHEVMTQPLVYGTVLYLGIVASLACYLCWNLTLKKLGTVRATNILYLQSFFTMLFGYLILDEKITLMAFIGALLLIFGTANATVSKS